MISFISSAVNVHTSKLCAYLFVHEWMFSRLWKYIIKHHQWTYTQASCVLIYLFMSVCSAIYGNVSWKSDLTMLRNCFWKISTFSFIYLFLHLFIFNKRVHANVAEQYQCETRADSFNWLIRSLVGSCSLNFNKTEIILKTIST